jgi:hypothetical protein
LAILERNWAATASTTSTGTRFGLGFPHRWSYNPS